MTDRYPADATYVDTKEAAEILRCNHKELCAARASARLLGRPAPKYIRVGQRKVLYRRADLVAWIEAGQHVDPTDDAVNAA
jgi:hypothetical protein